MINRLFKRFIRNLDGWLLLGLILLMATGLVVLYSASSQNLSRVLAQASNMLLGLAGMWVIANISPQNLERIAWPIYVVGIALLIGVALFGEVVNGARRWLHIGIARIQPSEIIKLALPLMLAWYFSRHESSLRLRDYAIATLLLLLPLVLIARQPDLGTALLIAASGFYVLFLAGLSWRLMAGLALVALAAAPLSWSMLHDYQQRRILTLLDPSQDPLGAGYHTIQSSIALGSGGIFGKGWLAGTQSRLDFLPERSTDFIFAVFAEEFGLVGNIVLLILFFLLAARGIMITINAPTLFSRLMAGSITLTFVTYAFVNMGMVSGILPVVGVPLPFISYGGTALVTLLLGFGILMSIQSNKKLMKR